MFPITVQCVCVIPFNNHLQFGHLKISFKITFSFGLRIVNLTMKYCMYKYINYGQAFLSPSATDGKSFWPSWRRAHTEAHDQTLLSSQWVWPLHSQSPWGILSVFLTSVLVPSNYTYLNTYILREISKWNIVYDKPYIYVCIYIYIYIYIYILPNKQAY